MIAHLGIRELASIALPTGKREGLFLMITFKAFFDDSGTHTNSAVTVMGGLLGTVSQWAAFETAWGEKLARPLPHKPPLKKFHLADCARGWGEFEGYNQGERDWAIREFREVIINSKLISTAAAVDARAWDELVVGEDREKLGSALKWCVLKCVEETHLIAQGHEEGQNIAIVFDRGMWIPELKEATDPYTYSLGTPRIVSINALAVVDSFPLQGADIVATENYWHACEFLKIGDDAIPRPHLQHYLNNMFHSAEIMDRPLIENWLARIHA